MLDFTETIIPKDNYYPGKTFAPLTHINPYSIVNIGTAKRIPGISFEKELAKAAKCRIHFIESEEYTRDLLSSEFYSGINSGEIEVSKGTFDRMQVSDGAVDIITMAMADESIDISNFKSECTRVLKQDGILYLVWNEFSEESAIFKALTELISKYYPEYPGLNAGLHYWCNNKDKLLGSYTISKASNNFFFTAHQLTRIIAYTLNSEENNEFMAELSKLAHRFCNKGEICITNNVVTLYGSLVQTIDDVN